MGDRTGIAWTGHTWSPWLGCTKLASPDPAGSACDHCYAASWAKRTGRPELWNGKRSRTSQAYWNRLYQWNKEAEARGEHAKVFPSLCDPFDNQAEPEWRQDMWDQIRAYPWLLFLLLTKRPQNIARMLPPDWDAGYPNVWLGTTVENQTEADRRIPHLLAVPARVRFLSCEPLLGAVNLRDLRIGIGLRRDALTGYGASEVSITGHAFRNAQEAIRMLRPTLPPTGSIDWIIIGGESGPGARSMRREWVDDLASQCREVTVPVFVKQIGSNRGPDWPTGITGKGDDPAQWPAELRVQEFPENECG